MDGMQDLSSQPNTIAESILQRAQSTQMALSPWVQRHLATNQLDAYESPLIQKTTALSTSFTQTILNRVQRAQTESTVWRSEAISLTPDIVEQFSQEVANRFPLQRIASKYQGRSDESNASDQRELPLAGSESISEPSLPKSQPAISPTAPATKEAPRPRGTELESQAPAPPHFMSKKEDRRPSWLPKREKKTEPSKPSIDIALNQENPAQPRKIKPDLRNLRAFSQVEYLSDMGKSMPEPDTPSGTPSISPDVAQPPKSDIARPAPDRNPAQTKPTKSPPPSSPSTSAPKLPTPAQRKISHAPPEVAPPEKPITTSRTPQSSEEAESPLMMPTSPPIENEDNFTASVSNTVTASPERPDQETAEAQVATPKIDTPQTTLPEETTSEPPTTQSLTDNPLPRSQMENSADPQAPKSDGSSERQPLAKKSVSEVPKPVQSNPSSLVETDQGPVEITATESTTPTQPSQLNEPLPIQRETPISPKQSESASVPTQPNLPKPTPRPSQNLPNQAGEPSSLAQHLVRRQTQAQQLPLNVSRSTPKPSPRPQTSTTPKQARVQLQAKGWRFKQKANEKTTSPQQVQRAVENLERSTDTGSTLPTEPRTTAEQVMGQDFGDVRVHTAQLAPLNIEAATKGTDIYVEGDQANFDTPQSMALLGHELTHVAQQTSRHPIAKPSSVIQTKPVGQTTVLPQVQSSLNLPEGDSTVALPEKTSAVQADEAEADANEKRILNYVQTKPIAKNLPTSQPQSSQSLLPVAKTKPETVFQPDVPQDIANWLVEEDRIQRTPLVSTAPKNRIDRQVEEAVESPTVEAEATETDEGDEETNEQAQPDLDQLAKQIYPIIKRMIAIERERRPRGGNLSFE